MADFAVAPAERNLPGNVLIDPALEHKKKKKKRKEKDREKEKKKDKSKKVSAFLNQLNLLFSRKKLLLNFSSFKPCNS